VFSFLYGMVEVFKGYFEDDLDEDALRDNFTLVYELLDGECEGDGGGRGDERCHVPAGVACGPQRSWTTDTRKTAAPTC